MPGAVPFGKSGYAFASSVVLHGALLGGGAWLLSRGLTGSTPRAPVTQPTELVVEVESPLVLPELAEHGSASTEPSELPPPLELTAGGRLLPRPDLERAGRGGERTSREQATNLVSSIDPISLERDPETQRNRSQASRLRTSRERASRDDRRATPTPMELTFLATGPGQVRARRASAETDPARGMRDAEQASALGSKLGGARSSDGGVGPDPAAGGELPGADRARFGQGAAGGRDAQEFHAAARVLFARPLVPAARAAVPSQARDRPNDTLDSSQEVASRVSSLLHASAAGGEVGPGVGGEQGGSVPGARGTAGLGSRSTPSGAGYGKDFSDDPGFSGYSRSLIAKLSQVLDGAFPEWAIEQGRGGHVIFEVTLRADGSPSGVRLVRPSGIDDYDHNVLVAVRGTRSFGRLPQGLGAPALFRVSWDAMNPVIGRSGRGPGGGHP